MLVIEHNLDVIGASDWLIDLGPEGGDAGGEVVVVGTPSEVMRHATSHTGKALREYARALATGTGYWPETETKCGRRCTESCSGDSTSRTPSRRVPPLPVQCQSQRRGSTHPRRSASTALASTISGTLMSTLPRNKFTVITGVSGSGKSTLAFDIVFGEGQRRYLESLNAYARQFVQPASRPDVDAIFGIPPTVAIEQRTSRGGRKSTVATLTEIYHFLRLLYVKLGTQYCPSCDVPIEPQSFDAIAARLLKEYRGASITLLAPLVIARKGIYKDLAAWAAKKGFAHLRVDGELLPTGKWPQTGSIQGALDRVARGDAQVTVKGETELRDACESRWNMARAWYTCEATGTAGNGTGRKAARYRGLAPTCSCFSTRRACPSCGTSFAELDPRLFSFNSKLGWCASCYGTGVAISGLRCRAEW